MTAMILLDELDQLEQEQQRLDYTDMSVQHTCTTCVHQGEPTCTAEADYSNGFGCDSYEPGVVGDMW